MDLLDQLAFPVPSVSAEEMAFALTFFVHAANQKIAPPYKEDTLSQHLRDNCSQLFTALNRAIEGLPKPERAPRSDEASLRVVLQALCFHYGESEDMIPLCARVLAFHLLMESTHGTVLKGRTSLDPDEARFVLLDAAVVEAIASVPLESSLLLPEDYFLAWLKGERP